MRSGQVKPGRSYALSELVVEIKKLFHEATSHGVPDPTASRVLWHIEDDLIQESVLIYRRVRLLYTFN